MHFNYDPRHCYSGCQDTVPVMWIRAVQQYWRLPGSGGKSPPKMGKNLNNKYWKNYITTQVNFVRNCLRELFYPLDSDPHYHQCGSTSLQDTAQGQCKVSPEQTYTLRTLFQILL